MATNTLVPPVTEQLAPGKASDTSTVTSSQSLGLVTGMVPSTFQALSVAASLVTATVKVAGLLSPPPAENTFSGVTDFVIVQSKVRVKEGVAVLVTVRSAPWQSVTVAEAKSPRPVIVAVFSCEVHLPAGSV